MDEGEVERWKWFLEEDVRCAFGPVNAVVVTDSRIQKTKTAGLVFSVDVLSPVKVRKFG